jgi:hypothetical protein
MLTAISMNYRYRMDFYPAMDLLAFTGLYVALHGVNLHRLNRWRRGLFLAAMVSVGSSFAAMVLYKLSFYGPSQAYLRDGIVAYYVRMLSP